MMDVTIQVAIIGALFTFFASMLATLVNFYRERSEKAKWERTLELEERRIRHEEDKWMLELNNQREMELCKMRLRTYPEVFATLGRLSRHTFREISENDLLEIADKLNEFGYSEAGLYMSFDTRMAVFELRNAILKVTKKELGVDRIQTGFRTNLLELLRRDLGLELSPWRKESFKALLEMNNDRIREIIKEDPTIKIVLKNLLKEKKNKS